MSAETEIAQAKIRRAKEVLEGIETPGFSEKPKLRLDEKDFAKLLDNYARVGRIKEKLQIILASPEPFKKLDLAESSLSNSLQKAKAKLAAYLEDPAEKILRQDQVDVMEALFNFLNEGNTAGYINLPSGFGKTVLLAELAAALGLKTVILSPTQIILNQTYKKAGQFTPNLDITNFYASQKNTAGTVINTTYQSIPFLISSGRLKPEEIELVLLDEAHKGLGDKRHTIYRNFPNALLVGLTATPYFTPLEGYKYRGLVKEGERWEELFTKLIHEMSLEEAMERGILTEAEVHFIRTNITVTDIQISQGEDYKKSELERHFNIEGRNFLAIAMVAGLDKIPDSVNIKGELRDQIEKLQTTIKGKPIVIFGVSVKQIETLAESLRKTGIKAQAVHGTSPDREKILKTYESGEIQVLLGVDLLQLGWDSPKTEVGIYMAPTKSGIVAVQEFGRILRPSPETGKEKAIAIQMVDQFSRPNQRPILISDILNPIYTLRGASRGLPINVNGKSFARRTPTVTFHGMQIEALLEESNTRFMLQERLSNADITGIEETLETVLSNVTYQNPEASILEAYQKFAEELPYFVRSKTQGELMQAVASIDSNISRAGRRVLVLLYMKSILTASNEYLTGDSEKDDEIIQVAVTAVLEGIEKNPNIDIQYHLSIYINNLVKSGVSAYLGTIEGLSPSFLKDPTAAEKKALALINEHFSRPYAHSLREIERVADEINEKTGVGITTLERILKFKNAQIIDDEVVTNEDFLNLRYLLDFKDKVDEYAEIHLTEREKAVYEARVIEEGGLGEIGESLDLSRERIRQLEAEVLMKLRDFELRPYMNSLEEPKFPKVYLKSKRAISTGEQFVTFLDKLGVEIEHFRSLFSSILLSPILRGGGLYTIEASLNRQSIFTLGELLTQTDRVLEEFTLSFYDFDRIKILAFNTIPLTEITLAERFALNLAFDRFRKLTHP